MKVAPLEAVPINGTIKFKNIFFNEDVVLHDERTELAEVAHLNPLAVDLDVWLDSGAFAQVKSLSQDI